MDNNTFSLNINLGELTDSTGKPVPNLPSGSPEERFNKAKPPEPKTEETSQMSKQLKTGAAALGAGAAAFAISNVGTITGSQAIQNQVNNTVKVIGYGVLLAKNPAVGLATLAFTIANNALKYAKETYEWNLAENRNNERIGAVVAKRGRI